MTRHQLQFEVLSDRDAAEIRNMAPQISIGAVEKLAKFHMDELRKEPALPPSRAVAYLADMRKRAESLLRDLQHPPRGVGHLLWYGQYVCKGKVWAESEANLRALIELLAKAPQGVCEEERRRVSPRRRLVDGLRSLLESTGYDVSSRRISELVRILEIVLRRCGDNADAREAVRFNRPPEIDPEDIPPENWGMVPD